MPSKSSLALALICALAPSVGMLTLGRFVQGLGGAALMVVPRASIRRPITGASCWPRWLSGRSWSLMPDSCQDDFAWRNSVRWSSMAQ